MQTTNKIHYSPIAVHLLAEILTIVKEEQSNTIYMVGKDVTYSTEIEPTNNTLNDTLRNGAWISESKSFHAIVYAGKDNDKYIFACPGLIIGGEKKHVHLHFKPAFTKPWLWQYRKKYMFRGKEILEVMA
jgi:hypothetical protein